MLPVIDSSEMLYTYLASLSEVTSIVGSDLYGPPGLPIGFVLRKAIVFFDVGSQYSDYIPIDRASYQLRCYGTTAAEAKHVWQVVERVLHRVKHRRITLAGGTVLFQYCHLVGGPNYSTEPSINWPFYGGTIELHFAENYLP